MRAQEWAKTSDMSILGASLEVSITKAKPNVPAVNVNCSREP